MLLPSNYHEGVKGAGNRGTRLDMRTMEDICRWAGIDLGLLGKAIKVKEAQSSPGIPAEGLYLQLGSSDGSTAAPVPLAHARSGHGRNPLLTTFDIVHVQSSPSHNPRGTPRFAFVHGRATGTPRFLQFNTDPTMAPRQITGVEKLSFDCLVQLNPLPFADGAASNSFKITMPPHHQGGQAQSYKVVLSPWNIPPQDNTFGLPLESLGVLVRKKSDKASVGLLKFLSGFLCPVLILHLHARPKTRRPYARIFKLSNSWQWTQHYSLDGKGYQVGFGN